MNCSQYPFGRQCQLVPTGLVAAPAEMAGRDWEIEGLFLFNRPTGNVWCRVLTGVSHAVGCRWGPVSVSAGTRVPPRFTPAAELKIVPFLFPVPVVLPGRYFKKKTNNQINKKSPQCPCFPFSVGKSILWRENGSGERDSGIPCSSGICPSLPQNCLQPLSCILGFWRGEATPLLSGIACLNKRSAEVLSFGNLAWDPLPSVCKHLDGQKCSLLTQSYYCLC